MEELQPCGRFGTRARVYSAGAAWQSIHSIRMSRKAPADRVTNLLLASATRTNGRKSPCPAKKNWLTRYHQESHLGTQEKKKCGVLDDIPPSKSTRDPHCYSRPTLGPGGLPPTFCLAHVPRRGKHSLGSSLALPHQFLIPATHTAKRTRDNTSRHTFAGRPTGIDLGHPDLSSLFLPSFGRGLKRVPSLAVFSHWIFILHKNTFSENPTRAEIGTFPCACIAAAIFTHHRRYQNGEGTNRNPIFSHIRSGKHKASVATRS